MADYYEQLKNLSERINREVPIEDVLALHGIHPVSKGKYRLRGDDDTPSASIYKPKNQIHDFGDNNSFNCCSFTAWFNDISYKEATLSLAESFGFEVPEQGKRNKSDKLSNWEWAKLNIHGDMASKNMTFNPDKYGDERTRIYAEKYRLSMSELKERGKTEPEDKEVYERIVRSKGIAYVLEMKNAYYADLYSWYRLNKDIRGEGEPITISQNSDAFAAVKELSFAEEILLKAIEGTSLQYFPSRYDVEKDFQRVINGEIPFEMGPHSQFEIQRVAYQEKTKPFYCLVSLDEYYKLVKNGLENMRYSAKRKGDTVSLSFVSTDSGRVNYLVRALRGKERNIMEGIENQNSLKKDIAEDVVIQSVEGVHNEKSSSREYIDMN